MYTRFHIKIHNYQYHLGCNGSNIENIDLKYCPVYLADRLYLIVAVAGDRYGIFGYALGPYKINYHMWKICCGKPQNLANWPAEFGKICCGKL